MARSLRRGVATLVAVAAVVVGAVVLVVLFTEGDAGDPEETPAAATSVTDETGTIRLRVPETWADRRLSPFGADPEATIPRIEAAPDLLAYREAIDAPGVEFLFTDALAPDEQDRLLDEVVARSGADRECTARGTEPFRDRGFEGEVRLFDACGQARTTLWVVVASPTGGSGLAVLAVQAAAPAERDLILGSFELVE